LRSRIVLGVLSSLFCRAGAARGAGVGVTIDWVFSGNPGNAPDTARQQLLRRELRRRRYSYFIAKVEVTNAQYAELLNAKAAADPLGLYNRTWAAKRRRHHAQRNDRQHTYAVKPGFANKPVNFVCSTTRCASQLAEQRPGEWGYGGRRVYASRGTATPATDRRSGSTAERSFSERERVVQGGVTTIRRRRATSTSRRD